MDCSVHFILPTLRIQNNEDQNQNQNFVFCMTTSEPKKVLSLQKEFSQWWTHHSRLWLTSPDAWVARGNPTSPRRVVREMPRCPSTWIETPIFCWDSKISMEYTRTYCIYNISVYVDIYIYHHIYYQHIITRLSSYYQMYSYIYYMSITLDHRTWLKGWDSPLTAEERDMSRVGFQAVQNAPQSTLETEWRLTTPVSTSWLVRTKWFGSLEVTIPIISNTDLYHDVYLCI